MNEKPDQAELDPSQPLEQISAARDDEQVRQPKRSMSGILTELKGNKAALLVIGLVVVAGISFVISKRNQQKVVETPPTQIVVPVGDAGATRSDQDSRVAGLDHQTEVAAAGKAQQVGGSYIPPLAPLGSPDDEAPPAKIETKSAPAMAQMPSEQRPQNKADSKRAQAIQKSTELQLNRLSARVYGSGKVSSTPTVLDMETLTAAGGASYGEAAGGTSGGSSGNGSSLGYPMGTVWKATLKTGADTDRPGTVKAIIEEGPFAGREALCNFSWPSREYINLECFAIKLDNESLPVTMVAVGPDEMPNLHAEYNGRYIQRLGSRFLAAFPGAYAEGLAMGGTTTTNGSATTSTEPELTGKDLVLYAAGKATAPFVEEAEQIANEIKPQAKVPAMQLIGLMLAEDI